MGHILPSNRVASLATFIAGLAGCVTALAQVWPNPTLNEAALIAGSVGTLAGPLSHVIGSWFWDRTPAGQAQALARAGATPIDEPTAGLSPEPDGAVPDLPDPPANWNEQTPPTPAPAQPAPAPSPPAPPQA